MTLLPTSLYPAQTLDLRIDWGAETPVTDGWADAHGYLLYEDSAGRSWRTDYFIRESNGRYYFEFERNLQVEPGSNPDAEFQIIYGPGTRGLLGSGPAAGAFPTR